jgi:hypothetical protein
MMPRDKASKANIDKKIKAFDNLRTTTHWANRTKLFSKMPRTYGGPIPNVKQINPPVLKGEQEFLKAQYQIPFEAGTFALFPGWAQHLAPPTNSSYRVIVGCNAMPVGKANTDHYDQYEFSNPDDMVYYSLDEHLKNGYNKF